MRNISTMFDFMMIHDWIMEEQSKEESLRLFRKFSVFLLILFLLRFVENLWYTRVHVIHGIFHLLHHTQVITTKNGIQSHIH